MGLLSSFKVMKIEDSDKDVITLRTSRACVFLGLLFGFAGGAIMCQLLIGNLFPVLFRFCLFALFVAAGFLLAGLILITYRKSVVLNKLQQKILLEESSILGLRKTAFHFEDILKLELTRDSECICAKSASLWLVKAYVRHYDNFSVEKVFSSVSPVDAKFVAESLAFATNKELIISCQPTERLIFSSVI